MTDLVPESSQIFECDVCDYSTTRNSQYMRHLTTAKHSRMTNNDKNVPNSSVHICHCGRSYKYRQGLFSHRKRCDAYNQTMPESTSTSISLLPHFDAALVIELLKQNQEFKDIMLEQSRQIAEIILNHSISV